MIAYREKVYLEMQRIWPSEKNKLHQVTVKKTGYYLFGVVPLFIRYKIIQHRIL